MLRIVVEVVPGGDEGGTFEVARAHVANVSALADLSDYVVWVREHANPVAGTPAWEDSGKIDSHKRRRSVWALVERAAAIATASAESRSGSRD